VTHKRSRVTFKNFKNFTMTRPASDFVSLATYLPTWRPKTLIQAILSKGISTINPDTEEVSHHFWGLDEFDVEIQDLCPPLEPVLIDSEVVLQAIFLIESWANEEAFITPNLDEYESQLPYKIGWFTPPNFEEIDWITYPSLVTLYDLLDIHKTKNPPHPGQLIQEIEANGCYKYTDYPTYRSFDATSLQTAHALAAVGMFIKYADNEDYWDWLDEENPLYLYGWPRDKVPKFRWWGDSEYPDPRYLNAVDDLSALYKDGFYTFGRLLWLRQATPAIINSALLANGVWKFTPIGDTVYLDGTHFVESNNIADAPNVESIQKSLVEFAKPILAGKKIEIEMLQLPDLSMYGWPYQSLPDFKELAKNAIPKQPKPQNPSPPITGNSASEVVPDEFVVDEILLPTNDSNDELSDRNKKGWEHLVMALLAFWKGEIPIKYGLDPYENLGDLQTVISKYFAGELTGLGQTSIDTKFGLANAHRDKVGLRPIKHVTSSPELKNAHRKKTNS